MPQLQVVNTTRDKPEPTGVEKLFSRLGKDYKDRNDQAEIGNILDEYKNNREDANSWEDMQLKLEKSNISPSKRLEVQSSLNDQRKIINTRDKDLNTLVAKKEAEATKSRIASEKVQVEKAKQAKEEEKSLKTQESIYNQYKDADFSDDEALRRSRFDSESTAKNVINERNKAKTDKRKEELEENKYKRTRSDKKEDDVEKYNRIRKDLMSDEQRKNEAEKEKYARNRSGKKEDEVEKYEREKSDKKDTMTPFEKIYSQNQAKQLVDLEADIPKAKDALANLDRVIDLSEKNLKGPKGYGKALLGTQDAAEMKSLSFTGIEPIIKLFNPVGPIPVQKLKIIQQEFQANPSDTRSRIRGKVNALRRIGKQGLDRAEQRAKMIRKYKGNPPWDEVAAFDEDSLAILDTLKNQEVNRLDKTKDSKPNKEGKIKVMSPDGRIGYMTQEQIDHAGGKNVIFTPTE